MTLEWAELLKLTNGRKIVIERVRLSDSGVAIEGPFGVPAMADLSADDLAFVAAFVKCHGSIKQMEKYFGISYPTVKNRLNRIGEQLEFVEIDIEQPAGMSSGISGLIDQLESGDLNVDEVVAKLKGDKNDE